MLRTALTRRFDIDEDRKHSFQFVLQIYSQDISVGTIVHIRRGEEVPADVVVLQSAAASGSCAICLSSLDGEALPKMRMAADTTQRLSPAQLASAEARLVCQQPNPRLYSFMGVAFLCFLFF